MRALAVVLAFLIASVLHRPTSRPTTQPLREHLGAETSRLQAHFDSVLAELATRDVSRLAAGQQASRRQLLAWLREYRDAATFPLNDHSDAVVPIFRDDGGVLCAMAYLIARSGRRDIVDHVASTRNFAYIAELGDDPALTVWLDSVGLDVREAGRIQPAYAVYERDVAQTSYVYASLAASAPALVLAGANLASPSRGRGWLGTTAGVAAVIVGLAGRINVPTFSEGGTTYSYAGNPRLGKLNVIAGGIGILAGIRAIRSEPRRPGAIAPAEPSRSLTVHTMPDPGGRTERIAVGLLQRFR